MSDSNWKRNAALGIVVTLILGFSWYTEPPRPSATEPKSENENGYREYDGSVTCEADCQVTFGFSDPDSSGEHKEGKAAGDRPDNGALTVGEADLLAQERMAHWTRIIGGLTAIGLALLAGTLWEAAEATNAATAAAKTAITTNETAKNAFAADSEPFLIVRPIKANKIKWDGCNFTPEKILFEISNVGRGPATVIELKRHWEACSPKTNPAPMELGEIGRGVRRANISIPIGPGMDSLPMKSRNEKLPSADPASWVYFHGYIKYKDISDNCYLSGYCMVYNPDEPELGLQIALPQKNAGKYNYRKKL